VTQQLVRPRPPMEDKTGAAAEAMELVDRFNAGDPDAFELIFRRYHLQVFSFVYRRLGNRQMAEDLTQDVFVRALTRLDRFQWQGSDLAAWLVTIARNLVVDHFKSRRFRVEVLVGEHPETVGNGRRQRQLLSSEPDPEDAVISYLENVNLLSLLAELTEEQEEVLVLRYLRGMSISETAEAMGKGEAAVKAMTYRASGAMYRLLASQAAA
jgi:RNA polymerase sigma-70 factor (ECF subfamily)